MEIIQKGIKAEGNYHILHLTIINPFLPKPLTTKEIAFLAAFLEIEGELVEDDRFNTVVRKKVMEKLGLSPGGMSNYLKALINKSIISKNEYSGRLSVHDALLPGDKAQGYQFKLIR